MALERAGVIDLVSLSADGGTVTIHLFADEPWPETGEGALKLQTKLKNYVAFAADGQLKERFPQARGKCVVIEICSAYPLGDLERKLVASAQEHWCQPENIALLVRDGGTR